MKADFNICDVCGKKVEQTFSFFVTTDRQMDAAGDSEDVGRNIDLCNVHAIEYIKYLLKDDFKKSYIVGKELLAWIDRKKREK